GDLGFRQHLLDRSQELQSGHLRHAQIDEDNVGRVAVKELQRGFRALCFIAGEAQAGADGHAKFTNALLVIDDQEMNTKILSHWSLLRLIPFAHDLFYGCEQLLYAKWFFNVRYARPAKCRGGLLVYGVSRY